MLHNTLIGIHTTGASLAFISGSLVLALHVRQNTNFRWMFNLFLVALIIMILFVISVIAVDWPKLDGTTRVIFPALAVLDLYMAWRALQSYRIRQEQREKWRLRYIDHIGFNMISLFDGFVIILAIDLGAPIWLVIILAVLGVAAGIWITNKVKAQVRA
jgi:hypothetical protein